MNISFIQENIRRKSFYITHHAFLATGERNITRSEMLKALYNGEIIERNPKSKPYSSFLVLGRLKSGDPLHIKCSQAPWEKD